MFKKYNDSIENTHVRVDHTHTIGQAKNNIQQQRNIYLT